MTNKLYATTSSPSLKIWLGGKCYTAKNGVLDLPEHAAKILDEMLVSEEHASTGAHVRPILDQKEAERLAKEHMAAQKPAAQRGVLSSSGPIRDVNPHEVPEGGKPGGEVSKLIAREPTLLQQPPESGNAEATHEANQAALDQAVLGPGHPDAGKKPEVVEPRKPGLLKRP